MGDALQAPPLAVTVALTPSPLPQERGKERDQESALHMRERVESAQTRTALLRCCTLTCEYGRAQDAREPGIGFSPDRMLQGRIFSYADAHRYRLGTHYEALPVNAPRCPVRHYHKDGAMRFFRNDAGNADAYYEPNSVDGPTQNGAYAEPPLALRGDADRYSHRDGADDFTQPGNLFRLFDAGQKQRLFSNLAAAMQGVPEPILRRQVALFTKCDPAYGEGVRRALNLDAPGDDRIKGTSATDQPTKASEPA